MSKIRIIVATLLLALVVAAIADEPPVLPLKTADKLADHEFRPERNTVFTVEDDRVLAYRLLQALMLELDYIPTLNAVERGDMIGPLLSKRLFRQNKLAEAALLTLTGQDEGTEITARALFVVPNRDYLVDQSKRRPSWAIRHLPKLYAAKKQLYLRTNNFNTYEILARAKENLLAGKDLQETAKWLHLAEQSTIARCLAGRQARTLSHAVETEIKRREKLAQAVKESQQKIEAAMQQRDWLAGHRAADEMIHVLLANQVAEDDELFVEAEQARTRCRRYLARRGAMVGFDPVIAPAEENDVAVGFSVVNVSTVPISSFKVVVTTTDALGNPTPGRIGRNHAYTVKVKPALQPNEYMTTTVRLRFEKPAKPINAKMRIVQVRVARKNKKIIR